MNRHMSEGLLKGKKQRNKWLERRHIDIWTRKKETCCKIPHLMNGLYQDKQFKTTSKPLMSLKRQKCYSTDLRSSRNTFSDQDDESQCDDSYVPRFMNSRRKRLQMKINEDESQTTAKFNSSLWKLEENVAYMNFLVENGQLFDGKWQERKSVKLNVLMSRQIGTRSPAQCRSHHQKMMKYHHSIPNIIGYIIDLQNKTAPAPQPEPTKQEKSQTVQTHTDDVVLKDFSQKWEQILEYQDLWNKMMDDKWLQGEDEFFAAV